MTNPAACSSGQVVVGSHVLNVSVSPPSSVIPLVSTAPNDKTVKKPFVLKYKNNLIKVCQDCRKNFDGCNDTMGLVVARAERRIVSNMATGVSFLGKESNSHYHLHMACITAVDSSFTSTDLVIPDSVKNQLSALQKVYLFICFNLSV